MIQPDKYLQVATHPSLRASGALARIWPVWLPSLVGYRTEDRDDGGLRAAELDPYEFLVTRLLDHRPRKDELGHTLAHVARLSPEVAEDRRSMHNAIEVEMRHDGQYWDVADIACKAVSQTVKLALVYHLAAQPDLLEQPASSITMEVWARAREVGSYHLLEAVRGQRQADEGGILQMARNVLAWITREARYEVSAATLTQYGPRPRPKADQAYEVCDLLVEHGYLRAYVDPGRRKPVYAVNPAFVDSPQAQAARERRGQANGANGSSGKTSAQAFWDSCADGLKGTVFDGDSTEGH